MSPLEDIGTSAGLLQGHKLIWNTTWKAFLWENPSWVWEEILLTVYAREGRAYSPIPQNKK